ncbi:hypothetical protein [Streptomyces sp. ERV7]|nr:hypothetical protein [Streptomyces sp. ERV7]
MADRTEERDRTRAAGASAVPRGPRARLDSRYADSSSTGSP